MTETTDATVRLYVGNLPYRALAEDVSVLFTSYDFIPTKIDMSTDTFTGRNPSYCFVELATADEASAAMQRLQGMLIIGRPVKINKVTPKADRDGSSPRIRTYDQRTGRGRNVMQHRPQESSRQRFQPYAYDRWRSEEPASDRWVRPQMDGERLHVGGLPRIEPQSTAQSKIRELFTDFNVLAISKMIPPHADTMRHPGNHYRCFVDVSNAHEAGMAITALNGMDLDWGGKLKVGRARGMGEHMTKVAREQYGVE